MLKTNKVLMAIAAMTLAAGLTGCGRENYQGTYTGYEQKLATTGTTGTFTGSGGMNQPSLVTLTLTDSGNVATGSYTVSQSYQMSPFPTNQGQQTQAGQFTASTENSGSLTNVQLMRFEAMGGSACLYTGSLSSSNRGQTINGTLTSPSASQSGSNMNMCPSIQISLTRGN